MTGAPDHTRDAGYEEWSVALDALEGQIRTLVRSTMLGEDGPEFVGLPLDLGPLPAELEWRAREMLQHVTDVESEMRAACDQVRDGIDALRVQRPPRSYASFVDLHA